MPNFRSSYRIVYISKKITRKLGEEKNLIAVMYCDNNFGTFTLQKQGTLELPNIIKDTVSKTKTIKIKGKQSITEENKCIFISDK